MNPSATIRAVIFDMDGVLVDSEPFICEAAREMFRRRYHIEVPPDDFLPFVGAGENRYIGGPAEKHNIPVTLPDDKITVYEIYLEIIRNRLKALDGATEFVRRCTTSGLKTAVASAADRMKVEGNLREIGLDGDRFDAVVTGSDVTRHKPDPQCFQLAAGKMEIDPGESLVVEDAVNGCRAAKAAGCFCLALTTSFDETDLRAAGADWTAPTLADVGDPLQQWLFGNTKP